MSDEWEAIRFKTLDELVTTAKLGGSALMLHGYTTPEGWPFVFLIAVAAPGNERVLVFAGEFAAQLSSVAPVAMADNPKERR